MSGRQRTKKRHADDTPPASMAYADLVAKAMSEDELQENVRIQAALFGWIHYHTRDSRRSEPGFMDSALARPPRFISRKIKISFLKRLETCCSRRLPCGRAVDAVWG